jgi:hypothetical protein
MLEFAMQFRRRGEMEPVACRIKGDQNFIHVAKKVVRADNQLIQHPAKLTALGNSAGFYKNPGAEVGFAQQVGMGTGDRI